MAKKKQSKKKAAKAKKQKSNATRQRSYSASSSESDGNSSSNHNATNATNTADGTYSRHGNFNRTPQVPHRKEYTRPMDKSSMLECLEQLCVDLKESDNQIRSAISDIPGSDEELDYDDEIEDDYCFDHEIETLEKMYGISQESAKNMDSDKALFQALNSLTEVGETEPFLARQALSMSLYDLYVRYKHPADAAFPDDNSNHVHNDHETSAELDPKQSPLANLGVEQLIRDLNYPSTVEGSSNLFTHHTLDLLKKNLKDTYVYYAYSDKVTLEERADFMILTNQARCQLVKAQVEGSISALDQIMFSTKGT